MADKILYIEGKNVMCKEGNSDSILRTISGPDYGNPTKAEWCENKKDFLVYTDKNHILKVSGNSMTYVK